MGQIIGIDLGTTYSCVAIPEERMDKGFLTIKSGKGLAVIQDKLKRRSTPSVVAEDKKGNIVVGYPAKGRAGQKPKPVMFAKRYMGEDHTFELDQQGVLRPEDVSAHILRYLKEMAEQQLGEPVTEAVITVPAYFTLKAKQMTEKAGEMAGLKVAQIAQEPVAAAMMYCANDDRDPLRIMTYDLGGGTFDVAVLEKRDGTISTSSIMAFDGDRFMGGYDFDKSLAFWILDQLNEMGYNLDPEDSVSFAKFMVYAEQAKRSLSQNESYEFTESQTGITDQDGNEVALEMEISREVFEDMIRSQIEYTIEICQRALAEKADTPLTIDDIDEIIMVGGSSRIPLVSELLEKAFNKKPKLVEPDLCIALGAAILAGAAGKFHGCLMLDPIPQETELPSLTITGKVSPSGELDSPENCIVRLRAMDGSYHANRTLSKKGGFVFDDVPLMLEDTTEFQIAVLSPAEKIIQEHQFCVVQKEDSKGGGWIDGVTNLLSKPLSILTVDGLHPVAPVRTPLPYETMIKASTSDTSGQIRISIFEENNPIGDIVMEDIPKSLQVGSALEIHLNIQENYQILARGYVPALSLEKKVVIDIPVPPQKSLEELRMDFELLIERAEDAKSAGGTGLLFGNAVVARLDKRISHCKQMFAGRSPEPLKIQDCLHEIESMVREISTGWKPEPPKAIFDQKAKETDSIIASLINKYPEMKEDGFDGRLSAIQKDAEKAYQEQNSASWKEAYSKLLRLNDQLINIARSKETGSDGGNGTPPPPDPSALILQLKQGLENIESKVKEEKRYDEFKEDLKGLHDSLDGLDPQSPDSMTKIRDWYFTKFEPFLRQMNADPDSIGLPRISA